MEPTTRKPATPQPSGREEQRELTEAELGAVADVMLSVVYADGVLGDQEQATIRKAFASLLDCLTDDLRVDALLAAATVRLSNEGIEARLSAAKETLGDGDARRVAYDAAAQAAAADGLDPSEADALLQLARALDLNTPNAQRTS